MKDDNARVRQGIGSFLKSMEDIGGVPKMKFMSCFNMTSGDGACTNAGELPQSVELVDVQVSSSTALYLAIGFLCQRASMQECAQLAGTDQKKIIAYVDETNTKTGEFTWDSYWKQDFPGRLGELKDFFSGTVPQVVIVVSDDNSVVTAPQFVNFWKGQYGNTDLFRFYGFVSPSKGTNYRILTQLVQGKTFDITSNLTNQGSWDAAFKSLTSHIKDSFRDVIELTLKTTFTFKNDKPKTILNVIIDGSAKGLDALEKHSDTEFTVKKDLVKKDSKITIEYKLTPKEDSSKSEDDTKKS